MTVNEAKYDVYNRLQQRSDDSDLSLRQVEQWLSVAANKLVKEYYDRNIEEYPDSMQKAFEGVSILKKKGDFYDAIVELPTEVYNLEDSQGVRLVMRPGGECIESLGSIKEWKIQQNTTFGARSEGYVKLGDKLYLIGKFPANLKLTLVLIPSRLGAFEDDDEFPAPSELEHDILDAAELIGRRKLGLRLDRINDGNDES